VALSFTSLSSVSWRWHQYTVRGGEKGKGVFFSLPILGCLYLGTVYHFPGATAPADVDCSLPSCVSKAFWGTWLRDHRDVMVSVGWVLSSSWQRVACGPPMSKQTWLPRATQSGATCHGSISFPQFLYLSCSLLSEQILGQIHW
jgi:hypothetical protein